MKKVTPHTKRLTILMLLIGISASAQAFKSGALYYTVLSEEDCTVEVAPYRRGDSENRNYVLGDIEIPREVKYKSKTYTVTSIGAQAFLFCFDLKSVTIPNSVTTIGRSAFESCDKMTTALPNSVTTIGEYAFCDCWCLNTAIPNSVTDIGKEAFWKCSLSSVTIPNGITSIREGTFFGSALTSVTIPSSVTYIGEDAFAYTRLTSVTIPSSVTYIGEGAFSIEPYDYIDGNNSSGLNAIYVHWEIPLKCNSIFYDSESHPDYSIFKEAKLYVPIGTREAYMQVEPWMNFENIEEMVFTAIDRIGADDKEGLHISVDNGILTIKGVGNQEAIFVYDMQGRIIYNGISHTIDNLSSGLYIVKAGNQTIKVSI